MGKLLALDQFRSKRLIVCLKDEDLNTPVGPYLIAETKGIFNILVKGPTRSQLAPRRIRTAGMAVVTEARSQEM